MFIEAEKVRDDSSTEGQGPLQEAAESIQVYYRVEEHNLMF